MAINKNHLFEDLNGVKCAIVETNVSESRVAFLKSLLEYNGFTVVVVPEAPPKAPAPAAPVVTPPASDAAPNDIAPTVAVEPPPPPPPTAFKIGVTDVSYNTTNAIYGRLLKTRDGRIVTMAYWLQKEKVSNDTIPYFDRIF